MQLVYWYQWDYRVGLKVRFIVDSLVDSQSIFLFGSRREKKAPFFFNHLKVRTQGRNTVEKIYAHESWVQKLH